MTDETAADTSPETGRTALPDWQANIGPGAILSCRVPLTEQEISETPKLRPCLVLEAVTIGGERHVMLA